LQQTGSPLSTQGERQVNGLLIGLPFGPLDSPLFSARHFSSLLCPESDLITAGQRIDAKDKKRL
jgi:hypothetical protein